MTVEAWRLVYAVRFRKKNLPVTVYITANPGAHETATEHRGLETGSLEFVAGGLGRVVYTVRPRVVTWVCGPGFNSTVCFHAVKLGV